MGEEVLELTILMRKEEALMSDGPFPLKLNN